MIEMAKLKTLASTSNSNSAELAMRSMRRIERELAAFAVPPHIPYNDDYLSKFNGMRNLHLGCGTNIIRSFVNIDIAGSCELKWDVRAGIPFPDGSVDFIFSEHFLEHVDFDHSARFIMKECCRVLCAGGQVIIGVPDVELPLAAYARDDKAAIEKIYQELYASRAPHPYEGAIDLINLFFHDEYAANKYSPHYWAYDFYALKKLFEGAGLNNVARLTAPPEVVNSTNRYASLYVGGLK